MNIYEIRCRCANYESYEAREDYEMAIGFYATKELAENAVKNLDILKVSKFEFPKLIKEYTEQDLNERNPYRNTDVSRKYIRGAQISDADDEEDEDLKLSWKLWDFYFEIIEHELIGS